MGCPECGLTHSPGAAPLRSQGGPLVPRHLTPPRRTLGPNHLVSLASLGFMAKLMCPPLPAMKQIIRRRRTEWEGGSRGQKDRERRV